MVRARVLGGKALEAATAMGEHGRTRGKEKKGVSVGLLGVSVRCPPAGLPGCTKFHASTAGTRKPSSEG